MYRRRSAQYERHTQMRNGELPDNQRHDMNPKDSNKTYHIYYDATEGFVRMDWYGYSTQEEFREGTEYMLRVLVENKAGKVLADVKDMTLIGRDDQNYVQYNFLPRAVDRGFKAIALVKPLNYFNAIAIETISYRVKEMQVHIRIFDDINSAADWLRSVPL